MDISPLAGYANHPAIKQARWKQSLEKALVQAGKTQYDAWNGVLAFRGLRFGRIGCGSTAYRREKEPFSFYGKLTGRISVLTRLACRSAPIGVICGSVFLALASARGSWRVEHRKCIRPLRNPHSTLRNAAFGARGRTRTGTPYGKRF